MILATYPSQTGHILGAGALGCLWGGVLSQFHPIRFISKANSYSDYPSELRYTLTSLKGKPNEYHFPIEPPFSNDLPPINKLLIFTKSFDVEAAFEGIKSRLNEHSQIVLFQNGMGPQQKIAQTYPNLLIYAATSTVGANKKEGIVIHAGAGKTWIGPLSHRAKLQPEPLQSLIKWFQKSPFSVQPSVHIEQSLWEKLAINCCINPFTAILNCPNGELRYQPYFQDRIHPLCQEISACATLEGMKLCEEEILEPVRIVLAATEHNISSMLQDIRLGKKTEIAAINGYILAIAKHHQLNCPINQSLFQSVLAMRN
jgi:2-dehydropantoate 2-reductase